MAPYATVVPRVLEREFECCQNKFPLPKQVQDIMFGYVMVIPLHITIYMGWSFKLQDSRESSR